MTAQRRVRRTKTARELAEQLGVSPRTIQRLVAEPRDEFVARAAQRRARVVELRQQGLKYREIAEAMDITIGSVGRLYHEARKKGEVPDPTQDEDGEPEKHAA